MLEKSVAAAPRNAVSASLQSHSHLMSAECCANWNWARHRTCRLRKGILGVMTLMFSWGYRLRIVWNQAITVV